MMIKKIVCGAVLAAMMSPTWAAVSFPRAQAIYEKIRVANHIDRAPILTMDSRDVINAKETGLEIVLYKGLLDRANEQELALIIGHELSHYILKHAGSTPKRELMADSLGARLMMNAGYDICIAREAFRRLIPGPGGFTHPPSEVRYKAMPCNK